MAILRTQAQQTGGQTQEPGPPQQPPPGYIDPQVGYQGQAQPVDQPSGGTPYGDITRNRALLRDGTGIRGPFGGPIEEGPYGPQMGRVDFSQWGGGHGVAIPSFGNNIPYGQLGPHTREVGPDELVENRITGLLDSDNPYVQNARRRGERAAAQRGALSSSVFAGASEAAAIDAALPIASQDAQTYSRVASENAAAINQNTLARMNSMTSALNAQIGALASTTNAQIASATNMNLGQMRIRAEENQTQFLAEQERFMQDVRQMDQMEIMELAQQYDIDLMNLGFDQNVELQTLAQQFALDRIGYQGQITDWLQDQQLTAGMMQGWGGMFTEAMMFLSQQGMDPEGFNAAMQPIIDLIHSQQEAWNTFTDENGMDMSGGGGG